MSELKAFVARKIDDGSCDPVPCIEVYLKSEADKVIAELKAQKAQAEDDCAYWKMNEGNAANAMHETEEYAMQLYKEAQHQKYKRCLSIARTCKRNRLNASVCGPIVKIDFWEKWYKRWLELAEKFKEAK
jgi:YesN/AraC family two-component response regulator